MNTRRKVLPFLLVSASLAATPVFAQEDAADDLDVSLIVLDADDAAEDAIDSLQNHEELALPDVASEEGKTHSAEGLATANDNIDKAAEAAGAGIAEAQQNAAEAAQEALEKAQQRINEGIASGAVDNIPQDVLDNLPAEAAGAVESALNTASDATESAEETATDAVDSARDTATDAVDSAQDAADNAADAADNAADAADNAADAAGNARG